MEDDITLTMGQQQDAYIAGKSLQFYWRVARFFIAFIVIFEAVNIIFDIYVSTYASWIIEAVAFILLTFWLVSKFRVKLTTAIVTSVITAVFAGLLLAVFDIAWYREWWQLLNIIRRPFMVTVVGLAATVISYLIFQSISFNKQKKDTQEGNVYGRTRHKQKEFK